MRRVLLEQFFRKLTRYSAVFLSMVHLSAPKTYVLNQTTIIITVVGPPKFRFLSLKKFLAVAEVIIGFFQMQDLTDLTYEHACSQLYL